MEGDEKATEHSLVVGEDGAGVVMADDENDVVADGEIMLHEAEGFAEEALETVARDGLAGDAFGDAEAEAGMGEVVGEHDGQERAFGLFEAVVEDGGECAAAAEDVGFGEGEGFQGKSE